MMKLGEEKQSTVFEILRYEDKQQWKALLCLTGVDDPFLDPEYMKVNEIIIPGELECFVYRDAKSLVLYPYIKRRIGSSEWYDITSPYGYGGFISFPECTDLSGFDRAFCDYCRDSNIVSEFVRFHPMYHGPEQMFGTNLEVVYHQPVVWVDYDNADVSLKGSKELRKKLAKAERSGLQVFEDTTFSYWDEFSQLYNRTMSWKGASAFYYFDRTFFEALLRRLKASCSLFVAVYEGRLIGGLLSLFGDRFGYNFLSGSDYAHNSLGTNEALQWEAVQAAHRRGVSAYLLGGGRGGEDSLFQFKAKFSPHRKGFFIGRRVHLAEAYEVICAEKGIEAAAGPNYFPLYRASVVPDLVEAPRTPSGLQCLLFPFLQATGDAVYLMQDVLNECVW